ncbi:bifunctional [glutamine synthetase] adenylyltransferase/[glutamine synthetase]-adenylyl-L-tyrosine phosphorylase [Stackebrandtia nassauensis]|uniref:(Glutamate--ammonia-ligase) adenylyltransferase n=1 Tax=Stackebrandtia nassauensis (strain DSM 44728 / CIP 108903 / NRRL B-16338 / NBRC 102104 / LLR-40K-21) TaxID=446470 RepID=D3Q8V4_STANL|nr:bifunctional [glutamine synthetase] adenylyltransferase/[glutamine synthetase]-adenylyl-L-tyrosine phosphorylase [Stackebrandtia nassauensis]ADD44546.1 (Glutamate--ammonia-ligase) adenylyltransferase [Stackebrandtia nassauensis DSM 44728]
MRDLIARQLARLREADPEAVAASSANIELHRRLTAVLAASETLGDRLVASPGLWKALRPNNSDGDGSDASGPAGLRQALADGSPQQPAAAHGLSGSPRTPANGTAKTRPAPADDEPESSSSAGLRQSPADGASGSPAVGPADLEQVRTSADAAELRAAYCRALLRITADDLTGDGELARVTGELSDLADATLTGALRIAEAEVPGDTSLAVIAMGKTGARELNYVSDVDVLFVAEGDLDLAARRAARLMSICQQAAWEVDAGLRPEGRNGALVRTVDSYLAYYRRWAHTWEFQALLKARPVTGDLELAERWLAEVEPLIWSAVDKPNAVDDIRAMRRRVVATLPPGAAEYQIKLGSGGLRDIEFAVQLLQLVHGRGDAKLRVRSTLDGLRALTDGGYLARADGEALTDAYCFLRTVEHRLQLQKLRRTHRVPDDDDDTYWLARVLGFRDVEEFRTEWRKHAAAARKLHEKLFYRPLLDAVAEIPADGLRLAPSAARARLEVLGFADPDGALRHISALTSGISRTAAIQRTLLPVLLGEFARAPEPDRGLLSYRKVSEKLGGSPWYLRLLRDGGPIALRLARLLATSRYFTDLLTRDPAALRLLAEDNDLRPRDAEVLRGGMAAAAARHDSPEAAIAAVRAMRRRELLRIACADLLGHIEVGQVGVALSDLTDAVLHTALTIAKSTVDDDVRLALIGMGRLGGRENSYASDADVLFVFDGDTPERAAAAASVVETMRRLLSAPAHEPPLNVDVSLRPEGRQGPVTRSLSAYRRYYSRWSRVWEAQALLRARYCAGDPKVAAEFLAIADAERYPAAGLSAESLVELRRIKARVDTERLPRGADRPTHVKLGPGGLTDVEWSVQLLQLTHGHAVPALRTTSTLAALSAAETAGLVDAKDAVALRESWLAASGIRDALTLARGTASDQLPRHGPELAAMLAAMGPAGDGDAGEFVDEYLRQARRAHTAAEHIFFGQE